MIMNILYVCPYYKPAYVYGGPVNSISSLCEGLSNEGAKVTVFTTNANWGSKLDVPPKHAVNVEGVLVYYFPLTFGGVSFFNALSYFYSSTLAKAVKTRILEFSVVVVDSLWGHALIPTATACIRSKIPYIVPVRGGLNSWALAKKKIKKGCYLRLLGRRYLNNASAIHCTDPIEAEEVKKLALKPPVFVVPNAIPSFRFDVFKKPGWLRKQFGISEYAHVMIFLGRITQYKRPDIAVAVLSAVQALNREIHLVIIGPDEDGILPQLRSQAKNLKCNDKLHLTGLLNREAVLSVLAEADLLLVPTEVQENFGMSAIEAMAAGVPILVSEGIPVGRWAQIAHAGRVVPSKKEAFQQAALELLSDPRELKLMGQRGRNLVRNHFDSKSVAQSMLAQYNAIINTGRPLPGSYLNYDQI